LETDQTLVLPNYSSLRSLAVSLVFFFWLFAAVFADLFRSLFKETLSLLIEELFFGLALAVVADGSMFSETSVGVFSFFAFSIILSPGTAASPEGLTSGALTLSTEEY
jgi:hypothetical protein